VPVVLTPDPGIADLVVVGGGIMGICAAAEAMRRSPGAAVTVVDRADIGGGASRYAPGIQLAIGRTARERDLATRSLRAWTSVSAEASWAIGRSCELYWLADDPELLRDMHVAGGPRSAPESALRASLSSLAITVGGRAILADRCSYTPVAPLIGAYRRRLEAAGCRFVEGFEASRLESGPAGVRVLRDGGDGMSGTEAVVALGPWAPRSPLVPRADEPFRSLRVKKVISLHLAQAPGPECPALAFQEDYAFLIPMVEAGYWLFSFTSDHWDVDPIPETLAVEAADLDKARSILGKWLPRVPEVASARVFCDCYSSDRVPIVAADRSAARVVFVGAGGGNGFRFAPACAEDALDLLASGRQAADRSAN
jgi:glycine/D-amino acid oxidase-like deaminating enzyme